MKQTKPYSVIYSDNDIVVFNKASGILTASDRYDKDTSGIVIYARNADAHRNLSIAFERRLVKKVYHALVHGRPAWNTYVSEAKLLPDGDAHHRTIVNKRLGKASCTEFKLIGTCGPFSWIEARPLTGRTHQIRAHLADLGISIVCDPLYSGNQKPVRLSDIKRSWHGDIYEERPLLSRLALHAYTIELAHPITEEPVKFTAPYQRDMNALRNQLAKIYKVDPLAETEQEDSQE